MSTKAREQRFRLKAQPWRPPTQSEAQEALVHLYLRLNGYLTTGFIVHSPERGKNVTQVDAVAVRHPRSAEPARVIEPAAFLDPSNRLIDVLICEVKTGRADLIFNAPLRDDYQALETVVRWVGLFEPERLANVVSRLRKLLREGCTREEGRVGVTEGDVRVRGLLCAPSLERAAETEPWFLPGSEILGYVHECLTRPRPLMSSIRYDFAGWGPWLEPLIRYFKALGQHRRPILEELYQFSGAVRVRDEPVIGG